MRVAIIADIHSNLIALEAVLADIAREAIQDIICLGDVVNIGPRPLEVIHKLQSLNCITIMGNHDDWMLDPHYHNRRKETKEIVDMRDWSAELLSQDDRAFIRTFQSTLTFYLANKTSLLCFHGSPRSNKDLIFASTPDDELDAMFGNHRATLLVGGHTHLQMLRYYKDMRILNPGSVGIPFTFYPDFGYSPWAEYAIVSEDSGRLHMDLRRIPLNIQALIEDALASGMPHANWWCQAWKVLP